MKSLVSAILRARMFLIASFAAWVCLAGTLDRYGRRTLDAGPYEAIVVAGCRVRPDGSPSLALARRAELGVQLWKEGRAPVLVFTGGVGDNAPAEATAAAALAVDRGVPLSAIRVEDQSSSTEENAKFAAAFGYQRVLVVTDAYHVFRAERTFRKHFSRADGVGSVGSLKTRTVGSMREVLAVAWYSASGRM